MTFKKFAEVYDEVMDQSVYADWLSFTKKNIDSYAKRPINNCLELACGTGAIARMLAKDGFNVVGLDLSEDMLAVAREKAMIDSLEELEDWELLEILKGEDGVDLAEGFKALDDWNLASSASEAQGSSKKKSKNKSTSGTLEWLQGDMCDLSSLNKCDMVTLYSDSLCYLTDFNQTKQVFKTVYDCLEEGGLFLFDVHSWHQMTEVFPGYQYNYTVDDLAFLWQSYEYEWPGSVEHVVQMFIEDEDGKFNRFEEVHVERTFPMDDYLRELKAVGFDFIDVQENFGEGPVTADASRWFFVCRK
ncbi:Methyltransferase domain-containing protein [Granulicatella balaenopterae]|uniref:Methyltransferase domain-containing protein n=1 Tax=Granulicatella balaenopterae TaxID=137733 RepID=A0A1H9IDH4_9LACT|nr:class I SAM-dependent methyltransferase [Granulicatella balaenopterae]SEQ72588.1 Methyltransferase domain-containing protein [Granulicatella balaenopterae]